jgi:hypothetical protein
MVRGHYADAYDNRELFYKEVPDGVTCIKTGYFMKAQSYAMLFVGSNCSIQGFDEEGNERFARLTQLLEHHQ